MRCPGHKCIHSFDAKFAKNIFGKTVLSYTEKECPICGFKLKDLFMNEELLLAYSERMLRACDYNSAKIAIQLACTEFKSTKAMIKYALMCFEGHGLEADSNKGLVFLKKAAEEYGDEQAIEMLADIFLDGKYEIEKNLELAYYFARKLKQGVIKTKYSELMEEFKEVNEVKPLGFFINANGTINQLIFDDIDESIENTISVVDEEREQLAIKMEAMNEHISYLESSIDDIGSYADVNSDSYFDWQTSRTKNERYYKEIENLKFNLPNPYHTRIKIINNNGETEDYYVGYECITDKNNKILVYSWTSPLGGIYSNEIDLEYTINGIHYQLDAKRKILIKDSELIDAEEVYNRKTGKNFKAYDDYLLKVLAIKKNEKEVSNIISTIQHHQNQIIRSDFNKHLLMQGCAGSGKTMVMFHRLKYMIANDYAKLNDFVILTPSGRFNNDIMPLLSQLNINNISLFSVEEFYSHIINLYTNGKWDGLFKGGYSTSSRTNEKGHLIHGKTYKFDCDNLVIKSDRLMDQSLVKYFYSMEFFEELQKLSVVKIGNIISSKVNKCTNENKKIDLRKLLLGTKESKLFPEGSLVPGVIHKCELFALAMLYYKRCGVNEYNPEKNKRNSEVNNDNLNLIEELLFKYIYIDEAQDLSKTEFKFLNSIGNFYEDRVFNIFGDKNQSVFSYAIKSWDEVSESIGKINMYEYNKNYRNTEEVVNYINDSVNSKMEAIGYNGKKIIYSRIEDVINLIHQNRDSRFAIISSAKNRAKLRKLYPEYAKWFLGVIDVKGVEFENACVILDGLTKTEKYIACSRTLNDLFIIE